MPDNDIEHAQEMIRLAQADLRRLGKEMAEIREDLAEWEKRLGKAQAQRETPDA